MDKIIIKKLEPATVDERGAIYDILEAEVKHIGYITFVKGAVRGKHYHKKSTQFTYMLSGRIELITKDLRQKEAEIEKVVMTARDLATIPPSIIHAYRALDDSVILDITTESRLGDGYESDTIRVDLNI